MTHLYFMRTCVIESPLLFTPVLENDTAGQTNAVIREGGGRDSFTKRFARGSKSERSELSRLASPSLVSSPAAELTADCSPATRKTPGANDLQRSLVPPAPAGNDPKICGQDGFNHPLRPSLSFASHVVIHNSHLFWLSNF